MCVHTYIFIYIDRYVNMYMVGRLVSRVHLVSYIKVQLAGMCNWPGSLTYIRVAWSC